MRGDGYETGSTRGIFTGRAMVYTRESHPASGDRSYVALREGTEYVPPTRRGHTAPRMARVKAERPGVDSTATHGAWMDDA